MSTSDRRTIVLCLDTKYERFAITLIEQMCSLEEDFRSKFNFHIICLAQTFLKELELFLIGKNIMYEFSHINFSMTADQMSGALHPESAYLKCFIGDSLYSSKIQSSDRVLYLDVDILLQKSMSFIFSRLEELDDGSMISARIEEGIHLHHELFFYMEDYFNSGFMMIDYKKMYDSKFNEKFLTAWDEYGVLPMSDQDYFNLILRDDSSLNALPTYFNHLFSPFDATAKLSYVVHFAGTSKPWNSFGWNVYFSSWRRYHYKNFDKIHFSFRLKVTELFRLFYNILYPVVLPFYLKFRKHRELI